jgi:hypothetical protein
MEDLWPSDITDDDVRSPEEILNEQAGQLAETTNQVLKAEVVKNRAADRVIVGLEVYSLAKRVRLVEIEHRPDHVYPVRVSGGFEMPEYLQDKIYRSAPIARLELMRTEGKWVDNKGVVATPSEFIQTLRELLHRKSVRATLISMIREAKTSSGATRE